MMKSHQVPPAGLDKKKKGHWHFSWTEMQSSRCSRGPSFCTPSHALGLRGQDSYWLPCLPRSIGEGEKYLSFLHPHENKGVTWILMNLLVNSWLILIRFLVSEMASSPPGGLLALAPSFWRTLSWFSWKEILQLNFAKKMKALFLSF